MVLSTRQTTSSLMRLHQKNMICRSPNAAKCQFKVESVKFLVNERFSQTQTRQEPLEKCQIRVMSQSWQILGVTNYLRKFIQQLSEIIQPLRELLGYGVIKKSMETIKQELMQQPTLVLYRQGTPLRISADASSYVLGEVLEQHQEN
ncbi:hypothetical protein PR048_026240 [Dryococelus australis]|uniref:Reverse transcriptase/retrotransposon-derived protein RNase H-like domain-containing protein n=1 Tax=Dryococelus australis TaxID=614101 RepID=A0ABQ9GKW0_9NEOP|nr:hypothetical protein PR048_026240 [Dryococelus australis]